MKALAASKPAFILRLILLTALLVGLCAKTSQAQEGGWQIETIDTRRSEAPTLVIDTNGHPHIAYTANGKLYYARHNGESWQIQNVPATNAVIAIIALDTEQHPVIGYYTYQANSILYTRYDGAAWHTAQAATNLSAIDTGSITFAVGPTNDLHFTYKLLDGKEINYLYQNGTQWQQNALFTLENSNRYINLGLAVDSAGHPHVCFTDPYATNLQYARYDGSIWHNETIVDRQVSSPKSCSIALDAQDHPHISYADFGLNYIHFNGASWQDAKINDDFFAGVQSSIALKPSGQPVIVYRHAAGEQYETLFYAELSGNTWQTESVTTLDDQKTPKSPDLAIDSQGTPHIVYLAYGSDSPVLYAKGAAPSQHTLFLPTLIMVK